MTTSPATGFVPAHGVWTDKDIAAHPRGAVAWARRERQVWADRGERNSLMDSGWSAGEADACARGIATCNGVELRALRILWDAAAAKVSEAKEAARNVMRLAGAIAESDPEFRDRVVREFEALLNEIGRALDASATGT